MSNIQTGFFIKNLKIFFNTRNSIVVSDLNVDQLYGEFFKDFQKIVLPAGEENKNLKNIEFIYEKFLDFEVDRESLIIGIGGGVVCDMAGFAASTYLRGLKFGFLPTTLLAQVDASVGGKNGVDFNGYKNIIGTFNFPEFIYIDFTFLKSLSNIEYLNGVAEILKYGFVRDRGLLEYTTNNRIKLIEKSDRVLKEVVERSISIKSEIVKRDKKEKNLRRILNFGHTFGHAFEKTLGISHGHAVASGMALSAKFSEMKGYIDTFTGKQIENYISDFGLPVKQKFSKRSVLNAIKKDKKRSGDDIRFVFLKGLGEPFIEKIAIKEIGDFLNALH